MTKQAQANAGTNIDDFLTESKRATHRVPVIFDAEGNPKSGFIIVDRNSPEYRDEFRAIRVEIAQKAGFRKAQIDQKTKAGAETTVELEDKHSLRLAVAIVVDWFGWTKGAKDADFDKDTVRLMFDKNPTWREDVNVAGFESANFPRG